MAEANIGVQDNIEEKKHNSLNSEVNNYDSETSFEEMYYQSEADNEKKKKGVITGTIMCINTDNGEIYVDIGEKTEGLLEISEIVDENGELPYKVNDKIKVVVENKRKNGMLILSHIKAMRKERAENFINNYDGDTNKVYNVKVVEKNKGGFLVVIEDGTEGFIPKTQIGVKDVSNLIGKHIDVKILSVDKDKKSILFTRKKILDEERKKKKELLKSILENDGIIEGKVRKITTYGMFVDVGGIDGLVHYSQISYKGPVNPNVAYKEGDIVPVKIINYDESKKHLSLSIKAALPDPWDDIKESSLEVGDTIKVTVSNIESYGAFVDLGNDIEGFLHISEIAWDKNIKNPKDYISENQELDVEVIEIDFDERRLRVSLKNLLQKPFVEFSTKYKIGDIVKGSITTITNFGAFVKIGSIEGLLHNEDVSWNKNDKCSEMFKTNDEVEVKIIKIDTENEKISLSIKELQESPVEKYAKKYSQNDVVSGRVRDIKDFGVFVELEDNVDALVRIEDLGTIDVKTLNVGDSIEAAIVFIDEKKNRIRLSVRKLSKQKERDAISEINSSEDKITIGDLIKDKLSDN